MLTKFHSLLCIAFLGATAIAGQPPNLPAASPLYGTDGNRYLADHPCHCWHIMTISYGGTVSLIKGLTKKEADEMYKRIHDEIWPDCPDPNGCMRRVGPGDLKDVQEFE